MSQTTFIAPVETIRGKLTGHRADDRVLVNRRKCFGKDAKGRPYYGPSETYIYHIHQGKWSEGAEQNRTLFQQVQEIVHFLVDAFQTEKIDTLEVLFPRFKNTLVQEPIIRRLLPISDLSAELDHLYEWMGIDRSQIKEENREFILEPNGRTILEQLPLLFLKKTLYQILLEAKASEHSARMVAMKGATDNAETLIQDLQLEYNKARQAGITQEIVEIAASQNAH